MDFSFPPEVITVAVRGYLRYGPSYRDVEELLVERGVAVDHVTIYCWGRVAPARCHAGAPSEPDLNGFHSSGSSKP
jgi:transposase-like protein